MAFIEIIKAIIIGIIEGITEWLPVSSTGHMILADEFIQLNVSDEFMSMFLVVIQLGAILAVVMLYFDKLNPLSPKKSASEKKDTMAIWYKVVIGVIPAGVFGLLLDDWLDEHLYNFVTVAVMLIVYGILFIVVENRKENILEKADNFEEMSYMTAFKIGMYQVLSLIPGTSRSGATILGGILSGASRPLAAEFSFFMSIPIMFGASALKIVKFGFSWTDFELMILLVGMLVAFIVSVITIRVLMKYIQNNDFKVFGWYRIVLGIIVLGYFWLS